MSDVTVIIPSIKKSTLPVAISSVKNQTYMGNVYSYVVLDGVPGTPKEIQSDWLLTLPYNVGGKGFYGHRIYAGIAHLINTPYVAFLDEDNWYEPDHIETLIHTIQTYDMDFVHSLRKIHDQNGNYLCDDNCESLGDFPTYVHDNAYHIDTSSYLFKTEFLITASHLWHFGWGADRRFFTILKERTQTKYQSSRRHTLCYRLDGNPNSVTKEFFDEGNAIMAERYPNGFPWHIDNNVETYKVS